MGARISGVNAIQAQVDGQIYSLPEIVPNKAELDYVRISGVQTHNSIIQYVYRTTSLKSIRNATSIARITQDYRQFIARHPNTLTDFYFQFPKEYDLLQTDVETLCKIQYDAGAKIISVYEQSRIQDVPALLRQMTSIRQQYPDHIISPTLDIEMRPRNLFANKLNALASTGDYKRINVIYRSIQQNITNWIDLSHGLFRRNLWCNVIGVQPRWHRTSMVSLVSTVFLFGVHTVSMGYPWVGTANAKPFVFNRAAHTFGNPTRQISYENSRATSVNSMTLEIAVARQHIQNGTYFTTYVPSKSGLVMALRSIA